MSNAVDTAEENDNAVAEAAVERYKEALGVDFEKAWQVGDDVDENTPDGKALSAAIEELAGECD